MPYSFRSDGAKKIGEALKPVGANVQEKITVAKGFSEEHIGLGATALVFRSAEAVVQIAGVVTGGRVLKSFVDFPRPGANIAKISAIDAIDVTGRLGGRLYSPEKLTQLEGYLARRGITLRVGEEFVPAGKAGAFDYGKGEIAFLSNRTQYEVWHELSHFRQYQKLGKAASAALPRSKDFSRENMFSRRSKIRRSVGANLILSSRMLLTLLNISEFR